MARAAQKRLAAEEAVINALNVFPVPDGDTGSNMLATVREAVGRASGSAPEELAASLASGALMGARGNSGVILSQVFRAQHEVLGHGVSVPAPEDIRRIMARAEQYAREAIVTPVDGTMLTVLAAAAEPAGSLLDIVRSAEAAVAATPDQLPILREAGVVDSGGYGLLVFLHGWYEALAGRPGPEPEVPLLGLDRARQQAAEGGHPAALVEHPDSGYGYCVTVLVETSNARERALREQLQRLGDSVLVVAANGCAKLHVHVADPEPVLRLARELGPVRQADVNNIDEQAGAAKPSIPVLAVVPGAGLARVFRGLGAATLAGGPGHNPSTASMLKASHALPRPAFLLPNNGNVLAVARQAAATEAGLLVTPTKSVPQGVAAALAYDAQAAPEQNLARMSAAAEQVLTAELVEAARPATLEGVEVRRGQTMVLLDGKLLGVEEPGLAALVERVRVAGSELATIYTGAGVSPADARKLHDYLAGALPSLQVESIHGDQPHARFIVGFE